MKKYRKSREDEEQNARSSKQKRRNYSSPLFKLMSDGIWWLKPTFAIIKMDLRQKVRWQLYKCRSYVLTWASQDTLQWQEQSRVAEVQLQLFDSVNLSVPNLPLGSVTASIMPAGSSLNTAVVWLGLSDVTPSLAQSLSCVYKFYKVTRIWLEGRGCAVPPVRAKASPSTSQHAQVPSSQFRRLFVQLCCLTIFSHSSIYSKSKSLAAEADCKEACGSLDISNTAPHKQKYFPRSIIARDRQQ